MFKTLQLCIFSSIVFCLSTPAVGTTNFADPIPDFTQTDIKGNLSGNGEQFCAPVAVSNSIMWLANFDTGQAELIKKLASPS